jgi:hypothetical protein
MSTLNPTYVPLTVGIAGYAGGPESALLRRLTAKALKPLALQSHSQAALNDLYTLQQEAAESGLCLTRETLETSKRFLLAWPKSLPIPELTLDTDGDVVFDWAGPNRNLVSVSLRHDGRIAYAAKLSPRRTMHGTEAFSDAVPESVVEAVRDLYSD